MKILKVIRLHKKKKETEKTRTELAREQFLTLLKRGLSFPIALR